VSTTASGWWKYSRLNPNCWRLVRYVRPARLQTWCAHHGVLTGRWTQPEIDACKERGRLMYEEIRPFISDLPEESDQ
jgi:hypothetical protein